MIAVCLIRDQPVYRRAAFCEGLHRAGYRVDHVGAPKTRRDLLVIWNRYGQYEAKANQWEQDGGTVLVAENGYCGKDEMGRQLYALAVHGHNGSGWWPIGEKDRFAALGFEVAPWVERPGYALICGQRGIGSREMASPVNWHINAARALNGRGPCKIRPHPGNQPAKTTLESDLAGAKECVVWSSSSGVKALLLGIPVAYDAPHWICAGAGVRFSGGRYEPVRDDAARLGALERMAWAQWRVAELESGEPFVLMRDQAENATW